MTWLTEMDVKKPRAVEYIENDILSADLIWNNPLESGNTQYNQVALLSPECDQLTNSCTTDQQGNRKYFIRGDVDKLKLVLVNNSKDRPDTSATVVSQTFAASFERVAVASQTEVLA